MKTNSPGNRIKSKEKIKSQIKINIQTPCNCKICDKEIKSLSGLASHIKNQHDGLSYFQYLIIYYDIDIKKLNDKYRSELEINKDINKNKKISGLLKRSSDRTGKSFKDMLNDDQYEKFRKSMKGVYTLDWFIKKYGDEIGKIKYEERSINVSKISHFRKYNKQNKENWSKISQLLFWEIYNIIKKSFTTIYFGELNHEYSCGVANNNYDFVVLDNKKIIEFNGDKFHANPNKFKSSDIPLKFLKKTSEEIWLLDKIKIEKAISNGFDVKIIWESDYLKNKNQILLECIKFILN